MTKDNKLKTKNYKMVEKVVLNIGVGRFLKDEKMLEQIIRDLSLIAGQKVIPTIAKKAIAGFKIREGIIVGYKTTLRNEKMQGFLDRLINIAFPRMRDFRGIDPKSLDQKGNLTIGIKEHIVFPETSAETARSIFGFEATLVLNHVNNKENALEIYKKLGIPFKK